MKRVLIITDVRFWERSSGNRSRIAALVSYLANHVRLTVVNTGPAPHGIEKVLAEQYKADFYVLEKNEYLDSDGYGCLLADFLQQKNFGTIIIEYIHNSYFLKFLQDGQYVILDAHDIISQRSNEFRQFNFGGALFELDRQTESEILDVYDKVMVLCRPDAEMIDSMIGPGRTLFCPHPVSLTPRRIRRDVKNIVFLGSAYPPNHDGIRFFLAHCWPKLSAVYPIEFHIYGTVCSDLELYDDPKIKVKGLEPDIDNIYADADIIINPVRFGAGIKIKNVEALANGLPLVTAPHGARGMEDGAGKAFLVAPEADDFTAALGSLIGNKAMRDTLGRNALAFAGQYFSEQMCFGSLVNELNRDLYPVCE